MGQPGSLDDTSNLIASRLVREAGLATHVPAEAEIASGAVDFFIAGRARTADVAGGARLGVHTWGGPGFAGADLPMGMLVEQHAPWHSRHSLRECRPTGPAVDDFQEPQCRRVDHSR